MTGAGHRLAWLLSLALAAAGALASHGLAYRIAEPDPELRRHLLEETGHGYLSLDLIGSLLAALVIVGFAGCVLAGVNRRDAPPLWIFALTPPVGFTLQEHAERMLHDGSLSVSPMLGPAFLVGLSLQIPFALIALLVARALLFAAGALSEQLGTPPRLLVLPPPAPPRPEPRRSRPRLAPRRPCAARRARAARPSESPRALDRSRPATESEEGGEEIRQHNPAKRNRLIGALAVALAVAAALAPAASAHSVLIRTQPGDDVVVPESPDRVLLEFNEPVDTSLGSLRVFDGQGRQVDDGQVTQPVPNEVAVGIDSELAPGTYTVAWRAVSADSDPISGAFVFHVLERGVGAAVSISALTDTSEAVDVLFTAGRFFDLALLLLVVGGSAVLVVALPSAEWPVRRRLYGVLAALAGALALVALANILLQGAAAGGLTLVDAFSWDLFTNVLDTRYGGVILIQSALAATLALTALALRHSEARDRRPLVALTLALSAGLAVTPSFSGHASTLNALGLASDVVHVVAASLWTGGLAFTLLGLLLSGDNRWLLAMTCVPRFSTMAVFSVVALIAAGIVSAYLQVRTWSGLWETEYGLLLLAKIALLLPLLALGAYNNRYAVPRCKSGIASPLERRRFLRTIGAELSIMTAVVAVTAVLINADPARTELEMEGMAAGEDHATMTDTTAEGHEPFEGSVQLGDMEAMVTVDPAMPGENTITIMFMETAEPPNKVNVSASLPSREIGPLELPAKPDRAEPGTYVIEGASLTIPGEWELRIEALLGEFDLLTETITVPIQRR